MIIFKDDENAYLGWIEDNPNGFVVNTNRNPNKNYLILHKANCWTISTSRRINYTTNDYIKICSLDLQELEKWVKNEVKGKLKSCGHCKPP